MNKSLFADFVMSLNNIQQYEAFVKMKDWEENNYHYICVIKDIHCMPI